MFSSLVESTFPDIRSTIIPTPSLDKRTHFSLDTSGVAGLLGGDDAVSAMTAVHVYENRRWLGWYNSPGSFQIAKRLSSFAKSFQSDTSKGPKFRAVQSGTVIEETSRLAALFMKECTASNSEGRLVQGRKTQPIRITIADLGQTPPLEMLPAGSTFSTLLLASIPIVASIGLCVFCAICGDWFASSLILVGIVASGVSCFVLGSTDVVFNHPKPADGSPAGDGILCSDKDFVLLKGTEGAVNSITRGSLSLRFLSATHPNLVRSCSVLFFVQFIAQLLFIPQASLFGQIMFIISLGVSGLYNAWLSSSDKEKAERKMLFERVLGNPKLRRYTLGTRTSAVVFMLLVLRPQDSTRLLNELLPNDTIVWKQWKAMVLNELGRPNGQTLFEGKVGKELSQQEQGLLENLYEDARNAYKGYRDYPGDLL